MNYKVLFVDSHADTQELVKHILESEGYQVVTASDRLEALSALEDDEFHLILIDVLLHRGGGRELCLEIRKKLGEVKIAYLTVLTLSEYQEVYGINDLDKLKIAGYIEKPFNKDMLLKKISLILSQ